MISLLLVHVLLEYVIARAISEAYGSACMQYIISAMFSSLIWITQSQLISFRSPHCSVAPAIFQDVYQYSYRVRIFSEIILRSKNLKVYIKIFPSITFPPWLHPVKIWLHIVNR